METGAIRAATHGNLQDAVKKLDLGPDSILVVDPKFVDLIELARTPGSYPTPIVVVQDLRSIQAFTRTQLKEMLASLDEMGEPKHA